MDEATPIYETLPGWKTSTRGIRRLADLPPRARDYLAYLAEISGAPFAFISTGPERNETIIEPDILARAGVKINHLS
jgi:adenylosuccinate synthase